MRSTIISEIQNPYTVHKSWIACLPSSIIFVHNMWMLYFYFRSDALWQPPQTSTIQLIGKGWLVGKGLWRSCSSSFPLLGELDTLCKMTSTEGKIVGMALYCLELRCRIPPSRDNCWRHTSRFHSPKPIKKICSIFEMPHSLLKNEGTARRPARLNRWRRQTPIVLFCLWANQIIPLIGSHYNLSVRLSTNRPNLLFFTSFDNDVMFELDVRYLSPLKIFEPWQTWTTNFVYLLQVARIPYELLYTVSILTMLDMMPWRDNVVLYD